MKYGKIIFLVDLQFGSTSKGRFAADIIREREIKYIGTNNLPNAGHTVIVDDYKFVGKALPASAILNRNSNTPKTIFIGPQAAFSINRLHEEAYQCEFDKRGQIIIHPRAMVLQPKHKEVEQSTTKHIASTMQGAGAVQAEKIMRKDVKLAYHLKGDIEIDNIKVADDDLAYQMMDIMNQGDDIFIEGHQGFSLDINHGHSYPTCTSRQTIYQQMLADFGIPHKYVGDIIGVIRADHEIRVGNIIENNIEVGNSGGWYRDQKEMTWEEYLPNKNIEEKTTVTQRVRRLATFSFYEFGRACKINNPTEIVIGFIDYMDESLKDTQGNMLFTDLPDNIKMFIERLRYIYNAKYERLGTGPNINNTIKILYKKGENHG